MGDLSAFVAHGGARRSKNLIKRSRIIIRFGQCRKPLQNAYGLCTGTRCVENPYKTPAAAQPHRRIWPNPTGTEPLPRDPNPTDAGGVLFPKIVVEPVRRKALPGLLVCQNAEVALQTAPNRDSGSDRQKIHRGESVLVSG